MTQPKDLVVLVADKDAEEVLKTLLAKRQPSLGIRSIRFDVYRHPRRDPGVLREAHDFLRSLQSRYRYALVVFDHEGAGPEVVAASELERQVQERLDNAGWRGRSSVVVIAPELEIWVWSRSPHVANALGWGTQQTLKLWLQEQGLWQSGTSKPRRPKEAMERALYKKRISWSSSIFSEIARRVSLQRCSDSQFSRLKDTLRQWLAEQPES